MSSGIISSYGCFTNWWASLPALPSNRKAIDWWALLNNTRATRYERLRRVWFDSTRFQSPKDDPLRPHEFGKPQHGTHITCKLWENFCLFDPSDWLPALMSAAGLHCNLTPIDCAWSYEFEAMVGTSARFKLADIVVHLRDASLNEFLLVVEAKRPGDKLKEACELPDTSPGSYLDREAFAAIPTRGLIYLVDDAYVSTVRRKIVSEDRRWGILSWSQLLSIQAQLCRKIFPSDLAEALVSIIAISADQSLIPNAGTNAREREVTQVCRSISLLLASDLPEYVRDYLQGSLQFLACSQGIRPETLAFPYLNDEPSFSVIHSLPKWQRQSTAERRKLLWQLPPSMR